MTISFVVDISLTFTTAFAYRIEIPPYYGVHITFIGTVSESYSTNITYATDEEDTIEDFVTRLSGGLDVYFEGKRRELGLRGRVNRQYRTETFDSLNPSENVDIYYRDTLSPYDRISLYNRFNHTRVPESFEEFSLSAECEQLRREQGLEAVRRDPDCRVFFQEFGRFEGNFESYENDFNAVYSRNVTQDISMNMNYGNELRWSSREDVNDSILHRTGIRTNYQYNPATSFNMAYSYAIRNFEDSGDISTHTPSIGISRYLTRRIILSGSMGINITTLSDGETSRGSNVRGRLTNEVSDQTSAWIEFVRSDSINSDKEDVFRNWEITGVFTSQLSEDLNSVLEGFYGEGDFVSSDITDRLFIGRVAFNYRIWEHKSGANLTCNLGYAYSNLTSTDEDRDYSISTINFGLRAGI